MYNKSYRQGVNACNLLATVLAMVFLSQLHLSWITKDLVLLLIAILLIEAVLMLSIRFFSINTRHQVIRLLLSTTQHRSFLFVSYILYVTVYGLALTVVMQSSAVGAIQSFGVVVLALLFVDQTFNISMRHMAAQLSQSNSQ